MPTRAVVPAFSTRPRRRKFVVYGPYSPKRTHACYAVTGVHPVAYGSMGQRLTGDDLVHRLFDLKVLRNDQDAPDPVEVWDLTHFNPQSNGLNDGYMKDAEVVVVAVPEQVNEIATERLARAYETSARPDVPQGARLETVIVRSDDSTEDVESKLRTAFHRL